MIAEQLHVGSGLGNQLFRTVATRVRALDLGVDFGMANPDLFKGLSFMNLDTGEQVLLDREWKLFDEKCIRDESGTDIRGFDPEYFFTEDDTIIEGEFQDLRYFGHRLDEVREWLKVEPLEMSDDLCVMNLRGGEYKPFPDLFLTKDYWTDAMKEILAINPGVQFEIHTDDLDLANDWFPGTKAIHDMGLNWRSIRYAKYLILSNSSFGILPALLNQDLKAKPIAPRFWARRNTGVWALPQNWYPQFRYI